MTSHRYRVIDTSGSELGFHTSDGGPLEEGEAVDVAEIGTVLIVEIYDDETGREGGVDATIVVETD